MSEVSHTVLSGGMARALGVHVTSLTRRRVAAKMVIKALHLNRSGVVNGGALMALADITSAAGAVANRPRGYTGGTLESKINFFLPAKPPVVLAVAVPLHMGRTTSVWQTTLTNAEGRRIAVVTQTHIALPEKFSA